MQAHSRRGKRRRRFSRKRGVLIIVAFCTSAAVALVGFLMYILSSMNWRLRYWRRHSSPPFMQCIVTAGPTYEPLDEVRRLTNFSTGRLGSELVNFLAARGHEATLLIGQQATYRGERHAQIGRA